MKIRLSQSQIQKQILAPSMQQSIEILLLPLLELNKTINQEIQENPLLEINEEKKDDEDTESGETEELKKRAEYLKNMVDRDFFVNLMDEESYEEKPIVKFETLEEKLLRDFKIEFSDPLKIKISEIIIGNLNEDGYLTLSLQEIADLMKINDLSLIETVLQSIQVFEPLGIAARNLQECLLIQARYYGYNTTVCKIIENHLEDLSKKKYTHIAKMQKVSCQEIKNAINLIAKLDPRPARNYRSLPSNTYIQPDVFVTKDENEGYQVHLNKEGLPPLRVNSQYKNMLKNNHLKAEEIEFIKEKMKNALYFIRSIEQRGNTLKAISEFIISKQKDFLDKGHLFLIPMTLKDIAEVLERNESTICRAINNKYIATPRGLYPMKFFFSQALSDKDVTSNRSIKEEIKDLVNSEDKSTPLSDQDLVRIFAGRGVTIARRTIAKYRKTMHILPTHLRKA